MIFVIDSTNTMFAFDAAGASAGSVAVPNVSDINGGGIAFAAGNVYVTSSAPSVTAYDLTLARKTLSAGAFAGLSVPRGIAYDCNDDEFYVGNGAAGVNAYRSAGATAATPGGFPNRYGPSGVAYDSDDDAIWVANYGGFTMSGTPLYGVAEYTSTGASARIPNYATDFVAPNVHEEPYSITVCTRAATGGAALVVVGFIDDNSHQGTGAVQAYTIDGAPHGRPIAGSLSRPYALSCDSKGRVYIADMTGLYSVDITTGSADLRLLAGNDGASLGSADAGVPESFDAGLARRPFAGLTPPIYGVLARN
jgi:hypothetical protein